jgi:hypothetical protein
MAAPDWLQPDHVGAEFAGAHTPGRITSSVEVSPAGGPEEFLNSRS